MKRTLTALTIAATRFASSASALDPDPDHLQKLQDTGSCLGCELWGADLAALQWGRYISLSYRSS